MDISYDIANLIERTKIENYDQFNNISLEKRVQKVNFVKILNNYFVNILDYKVRNYNFIREKANTLSTYIVENLTGNYEIGLGNNTFEEVDEKAETFTNILAYSDNEALENMLQENQENQLAKVLVDGSIASGIISYSEDEMIQQKAQKSFNKLEETMKNFFRTAIDNIIHLNRKIANGIAHVSGMDREDSKELNKNIIGKFIGGIGYELISGTLISKRHFTSVQNSESMKETIRNEGILHFSSPSNIEKIMCDKKIKKSSMFVSDMTSPKSFFFAGVPKFEDLLINIPAYDVMTAVRIKPTEEQMKELKYRALNDRAVVKDGDFEFNDEQAEIAYFGLMYDKEKDSIYFGELTKEEAEKFQVSEKVKNAYHYSNGRNSIVDNIKMNTYGLYAEYRHHQKLIQMERKIKERGFKNFSRVNDNVLVELSDIEEAYISTREKSVERKNILQKIKTKIESQKSRKGLIEQKYTDDIIEKEESEDERDI